MVRLELAEPWEFHKEVIIGVVDTAAAGVRLLLSLLNHTDAKRATINVKQTNKWNPSPAFDLKDKQLRCIESFSLGQTSFLVANTVIPEEESTTFALQLAQFILDHSKEENTRVSFLFGMDLGSRIKNESSPRRFIRANTMVDTPDSAPLPCDVPIRNGMVSALIHLLCTAEVFPEFCLLVVHGKAARSPLSPEQDGTLEVITGLGEMVCFLFPLLSSPLSDVNVSSLVPTSFTPASSSESLMYL